MATVRRHGDGDPLLRQRVRKGGGGLGPVLVEDGGGIHQGLGGVVIAPYPYHPSEGVDGQLHRGVGIHTDSGGGGGIGKSASGGEDHQGQGSKGRRHGPPAGRKAGAPPLQGIQRLIF